MGHTEDVSACEDTIDALGEYIIAREANTPAWKLKQLSETAQKYVDVTVDIVSGSFIMPKTHPSR